MPNKLSHKLLTVIMPNYNGCKFLARSMRSVLEQTYQNLELIVVDDGSIDNSHKIVKMFRQKDERVVFRKNQGRKGPSAARNVGFHSAKGNFIGFCDSDDIWLPEKAEKQIGLMSYNSDPFSYADSMIINDRGVETGELFSHKFPHNFKHAINTVHESLFYTNFINTSSVIIDRKTIGNALFDENFRYLEDWLFFLGITRGIRVSFVDTPLSYYRIYPGSTNLDQSGYRLNRIRAYKKILQEYQDIGSKVTSYLNKGIAINLMEQSQFRPAKQHLAHALMKSPFDPKIYYHMARLYYLKYGIRKW